MTSLSPSEARERKREREEAELHSSSNLQQPPLCWSKDKLRVRALLFLRKPLTSGLPPCLVEVRMKGRFGWGVFGVGILVVLGPWGVAGGPKDKSGRDGGFRALEEDILIGYKRPAKYCKTLPTEVTSPGCIEFEPDPIPLPFVSTKQRIGHL